VPTVGVARPSDFNTLIQYNTFCPSSYSAASGHFAVYLVLLEREYKLKINLDNAIFMRTLLSSRVQQTGLRLPLIVASPALRYQHIRSASVVLQKDKMTINTQQTGLYYS
jgi:hypothetical protein